MVQYLINDDSLVLKYWGMKGSGTLLVQDLFFLQRHQMLVHHEKELDHLKRMMERKEEELIKNQVLF